MILTSRKESSVSTATLTSKGQITLPQAVRQALGVEAGDKIDFVAEADGGIRVVALLESPLAICNALAIAQSSRRLCGLLFGTEDFGAASGIASAPEGMAVPAQLMALAAAAAGLQPLGLPGTVAEFTDLDAYRAVAMKARRIGMQHLGHAGDLSGGLRGRCGVRASHQHVHVAPALQCSGHRVECPTLDRGVVVFGDYQGSHLRSPSLRSSVCSPAWPRREPSRLHRAWAAR